jgi:hypothetical protein
MSLIKFGASTRNVLVKVPLFSAITVKEHVLCAKAKE